MLSREQRIGIFFLVGLLLLFAAIELTLGLGVLHPRYTIYATFRDVQGLDRGADVRIAGLRAGRVRDMAIDADQVRVALDVDRRFTVKKDATARLDFRALSGERFVAIDLGTPGSGPAVPGDTIAGEAPASLSDAVDKLTGVADRIGALATTLDADAGRLLGSLADVVDENRTTLAAVGEHLASITDKLDHGSGTLGLLLNDPQLYTKATSVLGDVAQSAQDLGQITRQLADGRGTLGKLLSTDEGLYSQLRDTVDDLGTAARNAQEITADLKDGRGTLGKALTDSTLYDQSLDTLRSAQRATQSVEDQAPLSLLGTIVTSLF